MTSKPDIKEPEPVAPPPTKSDLAVTQAERDVSLQQKKKKGAKASLVAGETGSVQEGNLNRKTLLGG